MREGNERQGLRNGRDFEEVRERREGRLRIDMRERWKNYCVERRKKCGGIMRERRGRGKRDKG